MQPAGSTQLSAFCPTHFTSRPSFNRPSCSTIRSGITLVETMAERLGWVECVAPNRRARRRAAEIRQSIDTQPPFYSLCKDLRHPPSTHSVRHLCLLCSRRSLLSVGGHSFPPSTHSIRPSTRSFPTFYSLSSALYSPSSNSHHAPEEHVKRRPPPLPRRRCPMHTRWNNYVASWLGHLHYGEKHRGAPSTPKSSEAHPFHSSIQG